MDNQQETRLAYIAGLMDGEGCLMITRYIRKGGKGSEHSYRAYIQFTNTNCELVAYYIGFLKDHNLPYFVHTDDRTDRKRKVCYQVVIPTLDGQKRWLELMSPWLIGKKAQAAILYDYVTRRIQRNSEAVQEKNSKGQFTNGGRAKFDDRDYAAFNGVTALNRGSSETTRVPQLLS